MTNIIHADMFRLRKGAAVRNILLVMLGLMLLYAVLNRFTESGSFAVIGVNFDSDIREALQNAAPANGAEFLSRMAAENYLPYLFFGFFVAVFGADFSAGTYRNTNSYETNRAKIYLARLALSVGICAAALVFNAVTGLVIGSAFFGFAGFSAAFFAKYGLALLMQMVVCIFLAAFTHAVLAFTRRNGPTITIFFVTTLVLSMLVQGLLMLMPNLTWLLALDVLSSFKLLASYSVAPLHVIVTIVVVNAGMAVAALVLGLTRYKQMDFN